MQNLQWTSALDIRQGDLVACVGAGGKTTMCWRVWNELRRQQSTILTTTTHILEPILPKDCALVLAKEIDTPGIAGLLRRATGLVLAAARLPNAVETFVYNDAAPALAVKLKGLTAGQIDALAAGLPGVTWLVEADGARGRSLKAPGPHEPVIPARAQIVIILASLDAIGHNLDDTIAHRPERIADILNIRIGDPIRAEDIARLLCHPDGGLKDAPPAARLVAVLSQRDSMQMHPQARRIAETILEVERYRRVVVASPRAAQPILEVFAR